jgi:hypothetical protein
VDFNDREWLPVFPYVSLPNDGYTTYPNPNVSVR